MSFAVPPDLDGRLRSVPKDFVQIDAPTSQPPSEQEESTAISGQTKVIDFVDGQSASGQTFVEGEQKYTLREQEDADVRETSSPSTIKSTTQAGMRQSASQQVIRDTVPVPQSPSVRMSPRGRIQTLGVRGVITGGKTVDYRSGEHNGHS